MINPGTYIIDRVTSGVAVLEDANGQNIEVEADLLPADAREGCVVNVASGPVISVDHAATEQRRADAAALRSRAPKGPSGDIDL